MSAIGDKQTIETISNTRQIWGQKSLPAVTAAVCKSSGAVAAGTVLLQPSQDDLIRADAAWLVRGRHEWNTAAGQDLRGDRGLAVRPNRFLTLPRLPSVIRRGHSMGSTGHFPAAQSSRSSSSRGSRETDMPISDERVREPM